MTPPTGAFGPPLVELRRWLLAELDAARQAAAEAREKTEWARSNEGRRAAIAMSHDHASAMAKIVTLGLTLQKIDELWSEDVGGEDGRVANLSEIAHGNRLDSDPSILLRLWT